jgi:hypothetical protein
MSRLDYRIAVNFFQNGKSFQPMSKPANTETPLSASEQSLVERCLKLVGKVQACGAYSSNQVEDWKKWSKAETLAGRLTGTEGVENYLVGKLRRDVLAEVNAQVAAGNYKPEQAKIWADCLKNENNLDYLCGYFKTVSSLAQKLKTAQAKVEKSFQVNESLLIPGVAETIQKIVQNRSQAENDQCSREIYKTNGLLGKTNLLSGQEKKERYSKICLQKTAGEMSAELGALENFLLERESNIGKFQALKLNDPQVAQDFYNQKIAVLPAEVRIRLGLRTSQAKAGTNVKISAEKIEAVKGIAGEASSVKNKEETMDKTTLKEKIQKHSGAFDTIAAKAKLLREISQQEKKKGGSVNAAVYTDVEEQEQFALPNSQPNYLNAVQRDENKPRENIFTRAGNFMSNLFQREPANLQTSTKQQLAQVIKTGDRGIKTGALEENPESKMEINLFQSGTTEELGTLARKIHDGQIKTKTKTGEDRFGFALGQTTATKQRAQDYLAAEHASAMRALTDELGLKQTAAANLETETRGKVGDITLFKLANSKEVAASLEKAA